MLIRDPVGVSQQACVEVQSAHLQGLQVGRHSSQVRIEDPFKIIVVLLRHRIDVQLPQPLQACEGVALCGDIRASVTLASYEARGFEPELQEGPVAGRLMCRWQLQPCPL